MVFRKFDIICLSQTYLDWSTTSDENNLEALRYKLLKSDHASNHKSDGVCICYKEFLLFKNFEQSNSARTCSFLGKKLVKNSETLSLCTDS